MRKKIFASLFSLLVILTSCGYEPIFSSKSIKNNSNISINKILFENDNNINNVFIRKLKFFQKNNAGSKNFNIILDVTKNKKIVSKNKLGDPETYNIEIIANTSITNDKNEVVYSSDIKNNKNYNNLENKFDLRQEEKIIINNLVDEIINEIISKIFSI